MFDESELGSIAGTEDVCCPKCGSEDCIAMEVK